MIRLRRLVRDYERRLDVSEAMIHVAMGALLLRRVAHRGFSHGHRGGPFQLRSTHEQHQLADRRRKIDGLLSQILTR